ncbi:hypothetical protein [Bacillus cereus]|nr:hypothetical protein [Bacillus cereus]
MKNVENIQFNKFEYGFAGLEPVKDKSNSDNPTKTIDVIPLENFYGL